DYEVENNGHSIVFTYKGNAWNAPSISGEALDWRRYSLAAFHYHWGSGNGYGSEHAIDGVRYEAELHLVHYDSQRYGSLQQALDAKNGGVAVLAALYQVCKLSFAKKIRVLHQRC